MNLNISSLEKAIASLEKAILRAKKNPVDEEVRDSVIQRFEYTYELCWKMLRRRLELDSPSPTTISSLGFKDLIREGAQFGLIQNPEAWFEYRRQRNITSHTYHEEKAISVYQTALVFLEDAQKLLSALQS